MPLRIFLAEINKPCWAYYNMASWRNGIRGALKMRWPMVVWVQVPLELFKTFVINISLNGCGCGEGLVERKRYARPSKLSATR